jgi:hypothetical protein
MYDFRNSVNTYFRFIGVLGQFFPPVGNFFAASPFDLLIVTNAYVSQQVFGHAHRSELYILIVLNLILISFGG